MKKSILVVALAVGAANPGIGATLFTFSSVPVLVSGASPSTVGWGYSITNQDDTNWFLVDTLNTLTGFAIGTLDTSMFDFPAVGPNATVLMSWTLNTAGLAQLLINPGVALGNYTGSLEILGTWYDGDPFSGGNPINGLQTNAATNISVVVIPEPTTLSLTGAGIIAVVALAQRRRRRNRAVRCRR